MCRLVPQGQFDDQTDVVAYQRLPQTSPKTVVLMNSLSNLFSMNSLSNLFSMNSLSNLFSMNSLSNLFSMNFVKLPVIDELLLN